MRWHLERPRKKAHELEGGGAPDAEQRAAPRRILVCSACQHRVADADDRIEISGRHEHTCVNPAGYVYRIACFRIAEGCVGQGEWTDHHTWFAGYFWQIAMCRQCGMHLGWAFTGDQHEFHGLIVNRITEGEG
jgi:hypothetical protein